MLKIKFASIKNIILSVILIQSTLQIHLIGFGSPIVDGVINYESAPEIIDKVKQDFSYHMSGNFSLDFYYEVLESQHAKVLLGGSAMNTIRSANFLLQLVNKNKNINSISFKTGYVGSIGDDKYGQLIKDGLLKEEISFLHQEFISNRTSTTIVLIENKERSFYSDLGVSELISKEHFESISDKIYNSKIFYADAYLIGKRFECFKYVFQNDNFSDLLLAINLAHTNIIEAHYENILQIFPFLDVIFVNKEEIKMLKRKFGVEENTMSNLEFIEFFCNKIDKVNKNKKRIIINTRGIQDVIVYVYDFIENKSEVYLVPIAQIKKKNIIDLNGAGDAFSGGFLAGLLLNLGYKEAAVLGNKLAAEVIQFKGFQIPVHRDAEFFNLKNLTHFHPKYNDDL